MIGHRRVPQKSAKKEGQSESYPSLPAGPSLLTVVPITPPLRIFLEIRKEIEVTKDGRSVKVKRPSSVLYKFPLKGRGQPDCTTAKITIDLKDGILEIEENIVHGPPRRQSMANMAWHYSLGGGECRINIYIGTHEYKILP